MAEPLSARGGLVGKMRAWAGLLLAILLAAPTVTGRLLVTGFATDLPGSEGDDGVEVTNTNSVPVTLAGVELRDGEGTLRFPDGAHIGAGARLRIALNESAYVRAARAAPDFALGAPEPSRAMRETRGSFRLAQSRDEVELWVGGTLEDVVRWGDGAGTSSGWSGAPIRMRGETFLRWYERPGEVDSDSADDWLVPSHARLGWRAPSVPRFEVAGEGTAFTAPDRSREMVERIMESAADSLRINVYEFRDVGLARKLLDRMAARPELDVSLLVDASPVGLDPEERIVRDSILAELDRAGARVRLMQHDRYDFDHAKYLIADRSRVLIQSENLVSSGIPADATSGNRGWGILIEDAALAGALADVFDFDFVLDEYGAREPGPEESRAEALPVVPIPNPHPLLATAASRGFAATLLVAPEGPLGADDPVLRALEGAREEILVEQLQFPPVWVDEDGTAWPNEYLEALLDAADRGVRVRVLLDGHFEDGGPTDNQATIDRLLAAGEETLEARLADDPATRVLHVKGLVVDGRYALVGSMNWNLHSIAQNREVDVLLDAPAFAEHYASAFEVDWAQASPVGRGDGLVPAPLGPATVICVAVLAAIVRWSTRSRSARSPS